MEENRHKIKSFPELGKLRKQAAYFSNIIPKDKSGNMKNQKKPTEE